MDADDGGGAGSGSDDGGKPDSGGESIEDFAKWLAEQPQHVQDAYTSHTKGLKSALDKERERAEAAEKERKEREAEKAQAEEAALKEKGEFQKLADQQAARLKELEPELETSRDAAEKAKAEAEQAREALQKYLDAELGELKLDEAWQELLKGKSPVEQMEWLAKHKAQISKQKPKGAQPSPNGDGNAAELTEQQRRALTKVTGW